MRLLEHLPKILGNWKFTQNLPIWKSFYCSIIECRSFARFARYGTTINTVWISTTITKKSKKRSFFSFVCKETFVSRKRDYRTFYHPLNISPLSLQQIELNWIPKINNFFSVYYETFCFVRDGPVFFIMVVY